MTTEIKMPACDRVMLLCLVLLAITTLIFAIAAFAKADEALSKISAITTSGV